MNTATIDNRDLAHCQSNDMLEKILSIVASLRDDLQTVRKEIKELKKGLGEVKDEIRSLKRIVEEKIDNAFKIILDMLKGYGIVDCEEEYLTESQVCERYGVCRRTMYKYRTEEGLPFIRLSDGVNSKILYRKADVIEFFAEKNATLTPKNK